MAALSSDYPTTFRFLSPSPKTEDVSHEVYLLLEAEFTAALLSLLKDIGNGCYCVRSLPLTNTSIRILYPMGCNWTPSMTSLLSRTNPEECLSKRRMVRRKGPSLWSYRGAWTDWRTETLFAPLIVHLISCVYCRLSGYTPSGVLSITTLLISGWTFPWQRYLQIIFFVL